MIKRLFSITLILGITLAVHAQNHIEYQMIRLDSTWESKVDPKLQHYVDEHKTELATKLGETIGQCDQTLNSFSPMSPLSNFLTDLLLDHAPQYTDDAAFQVCDISILNFGGIRAQLTEGPITLADIYALSPFDNYLVFIEIKGSELKKALSRFRAGKNDAPFAGAEITYLGNTPSKITVQGEPIQKDKIYKIVTLNFISEGGDNILSDIQYERTVYSNTIFRDFLIAEIRNMSRRGEHVKHNVDDRVRVLPQP